MFTLLTLALVSGCGSQSNGVSSKTPGAIVAAATAAAAEASSVRVQTSAATGSLSSILDMRYATDGAQGHLSLLGLSLGMVRIGDTLYVSGNGRFYRQLGRSLAGATGAGVAKLPAGTWLKAPANSGPLAQLGAIAEKDTELPLILGRGTPVTKGSKTSVAGRQAIELREAAKLYTGALYVATTGKPYPILQRKTGREHGQTTFTGWNRHATLTAPAGAIDLTQLEHDGR